LALKKLLELNNPTAVQIYTEELCNLHYGQGMDLYWRDSNTCPSEEEYLDMINNSNYFFLSFQSPFFSFL